MTRDVLPIHIKCYKYSRIKRPAIFGEVTAFSDLFDVEATLADELSIMMRRKITMQLFPDSKPLFYVIYKGSRTLEKRIILDIAAARLDLEME